LLQQINGKQYVPTTPQNEERKSLQQNDETDEAVVYLNCTTSQWCNYYQVREAAALQTP